MSITSECRREAFESVERSKMQALVYNCLLTFGPMSSEQIMEKIGTENPNNVRPRLSELKNLGFVRAVGSRKNKSLHRETVWEVTA